MGAPHGDWLLPAAGELTPAMIARVIASASSSGLHPTRRPRRIRKRVDVHQRKEAALAKPRIPIARTPYFCSGCPHNTSTRVPEGSRATAGIGCHVMAIWMDRRHRVHAHGRRRRAVDRPGAVHDEKHIFANLGDGTYYHSGLLAIRAAVAAKVNITYKILYNDAVAMTGGQPHDGPLTPQDIARQVAAEGVSKIVVVTDEPDKYPSGYFASDIVVHHRDQLDRVQRDLRKVEGTTVLIYDQTCAAEKRRRRKRGKFPDPAKRVVINELVCEGCGDCGIKSNCVSVAPVETEFGRKRTIDQSSCNKDYSCVNGFCPSFVTVEGGQLRKPRKPRHSIFPCCPHRVVASLAEPYGILVTGIGGTGVVTIGAMLGMAAHLEGRGVSVLDMAGLAQKNGSVVSHIRIAESPEKLHATRIAAGDAKLVLACDIVTGVGYESIAKMQRGVSKALVNTGLVMPAGIHAQPRHGVPDRVDGARDQRGGRAGRRRVPRRRHARDAPDGRLDRDQPVHGRLSRTSAACCRCPRRRSCAPSSSTRLRLTRTSSRSAGAAWRRTRRRRSRKPRRRRAPRPSRSASRSRSRRWSSGASSS
jgi:indolepyruvate ferredoxin oxidoreductase